MEGRRYPPGKLFAREDNRSRLPVPYLYRLVSNRGLPAAWNNGLGFRPVWSRSNGLATWTTSSDAADPILDSALDCPSDLPHTHLSSSASATPLPANAANCTNNAAASDGPVNPEHKRFVRTNAVKLFSPFKTRRETLIEKSWQILIANITPKR